VGWISEKTPPGPTSKCYDIKLYIRIKHEHCKECQSFLESPLTKAANTIGGWLSKKELRANPITLPQEMIDAIVEGWKVQIEHIKKQKLKLEEVEQERMQVCAVSAAVEDQGESSTRNSGVSVIYAEPDEDAASLSKSELDLTSE
jgi:hypothetical protein